ncbi:hypothetical protein [Hugenholtzia roseola]|nr:hypothetical protein [Hugenholtzia roseola]
MIGGRDKGKLIFALPPESINNHPMPTIEVKRTGLYRIKSKRKRLT